MIPPSQLVKQLLNTARVLKHAKARHGSNSRDNAQEQANEAWAVRLSGCHIWKNSFPLVQLKLTAHFFIPYPSNGTKLNTLCKKKKNIQLWGGFLFYKRDVKQSPNLNDSERRRNFTPSNNVHDVTYLERISKFSNNFLTSTMDTNCLLCGTN